MGKFLGTVVVVEKPKKESATKAGIIIPEQTLASKEMEEQLMKTWSKLKVHDVGDEVKKVKKGDDVYVIPRQLASADIAIFDGKEVFLVPEYHVLHVY